MRRLLQDCNLYASALCGKLLALRQGLRRTIAILCLLGGMFFCNVV